MYWIGVLGLITALVIAFSFMGSAGALLNLGSLFIVLVIVFPLLIFSGLFNYFLLGIKITIGKVKRAPADEVRKAIIAMKLAVKLILLSGFIGFLIGTISVLSNLSTVQMLGQSCALAIISILYSLLGVTFLLPVQSKVEAFLVDITKDMKIIDAFKEAADE